jgi:glycine betaine transporter
MIALIAIAGVFAPEHLAAAAGILTQSVFASIDWFFLATATVILGLALWLAFSRYGRLVLGKPGDEPDFSTGSWLAMLFAAGMGSGILFWGVAEPLLHFVSSPDSASRSPAAARQALVLTGLHWGLHAWALYALAALVLAYFVFRRGLPYLPGAPIRDVFPYRWAAPVAVLADLVAVLAIVFGVAGSIAMGTMQLQSGLHAVFGVSVNSKVVSAGIVLALFITYMASAATKLEQGIKWLSNINIVLAIALAALVLFAGPTSYMLKSFWTSLGDYLSQLPSLSIRLYPHQSDQSWLHSWTLTYLIWWIAWVPFVGIFVARISRGRTIRQFILGVLCVPTLFSMLWFAIFGGAGLYQELRGSSGVADLVQEDLTLALFALLERYPFGGVLSVVSLVLVFIFLVTSVDSATFVLGMLTSGGDLDPPRSRKIAWGVTLGLMGGALILAGSVDAVRALAIVGAIPFSFILVLQLVALVKALAHDARKL